MTSVNNVTSTVNETIVSQILTKAALNNDSEIQSLFDDGEKVFNDSASDANTNRKVIDSTRKTINNSKSNDAATQKMAHKRADYVKSGSVLYDTVATGKAVIKGNKATIQVKDKNGKVVAEQIRSYYNFDPATVYYRTNTFKDGQKTSIDNNPNGSRSITVYDFKNGEWNATEIFGTKPDGTVEKRTIENKENGQKLAKVETTKNGKTKTELETGLRQKQEYLSSKINHFIKYTTKRYQ